MNLTIWVVAALIDWLIIGAALGVAHFHPSIWSYIAAWVVVGNRLHALSILGHDGGHRLICKNRHLNDFLTYLFCFGPLFASIGPYRTFHFSHHRNLGTDLDPELTLQSATPPKLTWKRVLSRFILDMGGCGLPEIGAFAKLMRPISVVPFIWWGAATMGALVTGWWDSLLLTLISIGTSYWAFFRLRTYTEHYGIKGTFKIRPNLLIRLICPHNTWAHYEHHENPGIPFWKLPSVIGDE